MLVRANKRVGALARGNVRIFCGGAFAQSVSAIFQIYKRWKIVFLVSFSLSKRKKAETERFPHAFAKFILI